jgi:hypothetical protein
MSRTARPRRSPPAAALGPDGFGARELQLTANFYPVAIIREARANAVNAVKASKTRRDKRSCANANRT